MPQQTESLLDAITAGIESAGPAPIVEDLDDTVNADGDSTLDAADADQADDSESADDSDETPADGTEADADPAGGDEVAGEGDEPSGKGDDKTAAEAAGKGSKPAGEKPAEPAVKPKDPVNDPIPNALKKDTKERIQSLIAKVRETDTQAQKAVTERNELLGMITETKATPEQYGEALQYLSLVNSGDPVKQEQALQIMQAEVAALAKLLGKPVPGVDMLAEHPDLQQAVRDNLLLQEHAEEMAASRTRSKIQTTASTQRTQADQIQQQQNAALTEGRSGLNAFEEQARKTDKDYDRKRAILVPAMKPVFARTDPRQWPVLFKEAYDQLKLPQLTRVGGAPSAQPLRGKNPSGGAAKAPSNLFEAIDQGIANAGR